jgi:hypothetical protein
MANHSEADSADRGNASYLKTGSVPESSGIARLSLQDVLTLTVSHPHIAKTAMRYIPNQILERSLPRAKDATSGSTDRCLKTNG